jgi:hypothetical protein
MRIALQLFLISAKLRKPRRMSVWPVASHSRHIDDHTDQLTRGALLDLA